MRMRIGERTIGTGQPTVVIAEIGVNHDGCEKRALELVDAAADCGADAVKLQVFRAQRLMSDASQFAEYQKSRCEENDPVAMLRRYELPTASLRRIVRRIRERGMIPLATPFSLDDVGTIAELDLPAVKIASPDLVNRPLLSRAISVGKPLLISTGAATMDEVAAAVEWLRKSHMTFALLHCVSSYPAPAEQANLCWIGELAEWFSVPLGFSDHTTELSAGALAVMSGATIVEKHLTYDRGAAGPDHAASADLQQFAQYVQLIRTAERMRGMPGKRVLPIERDVRQVSRQSLVIRRDVREGDVIGEADLVVQRPGTGIPAAQFAAAVGRRVRRRIKAGTLLQWEMLSDAA